MMFAFLACLTIASILLIIYHHVVYPLLMEVLAYRPSALPEVATRGYRDSESDDSLPSVAIVIPACNEAAIIADKVRNLAALDYPSARLRVVIACDGCSDETAARARSAAAEAGCRHLRVDILEFARNRGKLAILNEVVPRVEAELIALSDASALISIDALLIAAAYFTNPRVGVVCATYRLLEPGNIGEAIYWEHQARLKEREAAIGAPLGAHGAFYMFRHRLFRKLPPDTINDDFILPMNIVLAGYRSVYDARMVAIELEGSDLRQDYRRRQRIAAGNVQQLVRLRSLMHPKHRGTAFAFASGKGLRAIMPLLMVVALFGSLVLAPRSPLFAMAAGAQVLLYSLAMLPRGLPKLKWPQPIEGIHYLVSGYVSGLVGMICYFSGARRSWTGSGRSSHAPCSSLQDLRTAAGGTGLSYVHPVVAIAKRALDIGLASVVLIISVPLLPVVALAIKLDSRGPVFFRQLRIGESRCDRTKLFHIIKFRTMTVDAEAGTGAVWASTDDPRITRVGAFLRRTRLDECPQLINVLRGEMSLVGPRPERPGLFAHLDNEIPYYRERISGCRPGMTGFAQINQCSDRTIDDVRVKLYYDHAYNLALSQPLTWLVLDMWILVRTIEVVLFGPELVYRRSNATWLKCRQENPEVRALRPAAEPRPVSDFDAAANKAEAPQVQSLAV